MINFLKDLMFPDVVLFGFPGQK